MIEDYANKNQEVDINIITLDERYIREFLAWFMLNNTEVEERK